MVSLGENIYYWSLRERFFFNRNRHGYCVIQRNEKMVTAGTHSRMTIYFVKWYIHTKVLVVVRNYYTDITEENCIYI